MSSGDLKFTFEGTLPGPPRRNLEEVAKCLGWGYEGVEAGWHVLSISLEVPLLKAPRLYMGEEPGRYVGRGAGGRANLRDPDREGGGGVSVGVSGPPERAHQHAGQTVFRGPGHPPRGEDNGVSLIHNCLMFQVVVATRSVYLWMLPPEFLVEFLM